METPGDWRIAEDYTCHLYRHVTQGELSITCAVTIDPSINEASDPACINQRRCHFLVISSKKEVDDAP